MTQYNFESIFAGKSDFLSNAKFSGGLSLESSAEVKEIYEKVYVRDNRLSGQTDIDINNGSLHNFTAEASGNFSFNIKGLQSIQPRRSIVVTILCNMGSSAYVMTNPSTTGFKIDGNAVVVKWIGSSPPPSGFANSINSYTFAIIKNSDISYTVLGSLSRFG